MTRESQERMPEHTSDLMIRLARASEAPEMSVGELLDALSDRAFGIVMLILALPTCLPFVYGIPQVLSVPLFLVAFQIFAGRRTLWMPKALKRRTFSRASFEALAVRAQKYLAWFEAISAPRLSFLVGRRLERFFGLFMMIFCISIALPLPLTNTTPGIAVAIMSIGFIERDGLLVLGGAALGTFWISMLMFFASTLLGWIAQLQAFLF